MHRIEVLYPLTKGGTFLWCWILSIKVPRMEDFLHQERSCVQKSNFPKFLSKGTSDCFEMQTSPKAGSKVVTRYHGNPGTLTGLMKFLIRFYLLFPLLIERPKDDSRLKLGGTPQKWSWERSATFLISSTVFLLGALKNSHCPQFY